RFPLRPAGPPNGQPSTRRIRSTSDEDDRPEPQPSAGPWRDWPPPVRRAATPPPAPAPAADQKPRPPCRTAAGEAPLDAARPALRTGGERRPPRGCSIRPNGLTGDNRVPASRTVHRALRP